MYRVVIAGLQGLRRQANTASERTRRYRDFRFGLTKHTRCSYNLIDEMNLSIVFEAKS